MIIGNSNNNFNNNDKIKGISGLNKNILNENNKFQKKIEQVCNNKAMLKERLKNGTISIEEFNKRCAALAKMK